MDGGAINMTLWDMAAVYGLMLLPLGVMAWLGLGMIRDTLVAMARMTVQLALVGLYLQVVFDLNSVWLNLGWILAMILVANATTLKRAGLVRRRFFMATFVGIAGVTAAVVGFFMIVLRPDPIYDARYLVPITGMVLGNCMRGNVLSLERFFSGIRDGEKEFITYQTLGATLFEAARPHMRQALRAALAPTLSTMATMGIVSLPGMMTGQILGGSVPLTAIKYQIAIMFCIFAGILLASVLNLLLSMRIGFDDYGMLRQEVFAK